MKELFTGNDSERAQEDWWHFFEVRYKRNLKLSREQGLLDRAGYIPVPGLMEVTKKSSHELASGTGRGSHFRYGEDVGNDTNRKFPEWYPKHPGANGF